MDYHEYNKLENKLFELEIKTFQLDAKHHKTPQDYIDLQLFDQEVLEFKKEFLVELQKIPIEKLSVFQHLKLWRLQIELGYIDPTSTKGE